MVARRILVPPVRVRILPRQHKERAESSRFGSFFLYPTRQGRLEKSVQIDPSRRKNVTPFVEIRLTLGDEIKMTPVGILRR